MPHSSHCVDFIREHSQRTLAMNGIDKSYMHPDDDTYIVIECIKKYVDITFGSFS